MKPTTGFAAPLRLRARLMYDGANYAGVQYQRNAPSVAAVLQQALATRLQHEISSLPRRLPTGCELVQELTAVGLR